MVYQICGDIYVDNELCIFLALNELISRYSLCGVLPKEDLNN